MDVDYHGMKISFVSLRMWINMKLKGKYIYMCVCVCVCVCVTKMRISCYQWYEIRHILMFQYKNRFSITNIYVREFMNSIHYQRIFDKLLYGNLTFVT